MGRPKKAKTVQVRIRANIAQMAEVIVAAGMASSVPDYLSDIMLERVERDFKVAQKRIAQMDADRLRKEVEP